MDVQQASEGCGFIIREHVSRVELRSLTAAQPSPCLLGSKLPGRRLRRRDPSRVVGLSPGEAFP